MNRYLTYFKVFIFFVLISPSFLQAALVYEAASNVRTHVPQGTDEVVMLGFRLSDDGAEEVSINSVRVKNTASQVKFGRGIDAISLYRDENDNFLLDENTDVQIRRQIFTDVTEFVEFQFNPEAISSQNEVTYLLVYEVNNFATAGATTNIIIEEIGSSDTNDLVTSTVKSSSTPTTNEVTITGITITVDDISPDVVLPGQKDVPMLYVTMRMVGESISNPSSVVMSYFNLDANYITDSNSNDGISKVYLYNTTKPPSDPTFVKQNEVDNGFLVKTLTSSTFRDKSNIDFSFPPYSGPFSGFSTNPPTPTENFFIVYDVGDTITVTTDTTISAEFLSFIGTGDRSGLSVTNTASNNFESAVAKVAGLSLVENTIRSIIPATDAFGQLTSAPMLRFKLRANHIDVTINSITILNPDDEATLPFVSSASNSSGITGVDIYEDSNGDNVLSEELDTKIGSYDNTQFSSFTGTVQNEQIKIPLSTPSSSTSGFKISQYNSDNSYPNDNDVVIFVVYHFGSGVFSETTDSTKTAIARLGSVVASANLTINGIPTENRLTLSGVSNTNPSQASPDAKITLTRTNLSIVNVTDISPDTVIQGETKVPMLAIELDASENFVSNNIRILNDELSFLNNNAGVSKVWLYADGVSNDGTNGAFDSTDLFKQAISRFSSNQFANLRSISMNNGNNLLLILYDIGQAASIGQNNIRAQLSDIIGEDAQEVTLGGETPNPRQAVSATVAAKKLSRPTISGVLSNEDGLDPFTIQVTLQNTSADDVIITALEPKIYLGTIDGTDITFEFDITNTSTTFPTTLTSGSQLTVTYTLTHERDFSQGTALLDVIVNYTYVDGSTRTAQLIRYQGNTQWFSAASQAPSLLLTGNERPNSWQLPSYIQEVKVLRGGSTQITFVNSEALSSTDQLVIKLRNIQDIQRESLVLRLNGSEIPELQILDTSSTGTTGFTFNEDTREITIAKLGTTDGILTIDLNDNNGTALETAELFFSIDPEKVVINRALFYPNPYRMGSEDLKLGFTLTQPAKVDVYLYNHLGQQVAHQTLESISTKIGYNTMTFGMFNSFLAPGIYVCKIVAQDNQGNTAHAVSRLAIF